MESSAVKHDVLNQVLSDQYNSSVSQSPISFARLYCIKNLHDLQTEILNLLSYTWVDHVNTRDYLGGWDVLALRCQRQHFASNPLLQSFAIQEGDEWESLPILESCVLIKQVLAFLQCPVKAVRLMRLKAGAEIKPHRDHELSIEFGEARLHMPIQINSHVHFYVDKKMIPMQAGELWYFNADQTHEVYNHGDEDRINLVIDCVANEWLCSQIVTGAKNEILNK